MYTEAYLPLAVNLLGDNQRRLMCTLTSGITLSEFVDGRADAYSVDCRRADVNTEGDTAAFGGSGCSRYLSSVVGVLREHGYTIPPHGVTIRSDIGCPIGLHQSVAVVTCYVNWLKARFREQLAQVDKVWVVGQAFCRLGLEWPMGVRAADLEKQSTIYLETPEGLSRLAYWPRNWRLLFCHPTAGVRCADVIPTRWRDDVCLSDQDVTEAVAALNSANLAELREAMRTRFIKRILNGWPISEEMSAMVVPVMDICRHAAFVAAGTYLVVISDSEVEANELRSYATVAGMPFSIFQLT